MRAERADWVGQTAAIGGILGGVTNQRLPRPDPAGLRARPAAGTPPPPAAARRATLPLALAALVISILGLGLATWRVIVPADSGCQGGAWGVTPAASDLPDGWSVASSQYDIARKTMSLTGPIPADQAASQAVIYATVTCFAQGAAESITRSADAATAAGQKVVARNDLGDQGFSAADKSGATFLQFRHGSVVVYLAASGDATAGEVDELASAFDKAMGGDGGALALVSPVSASVGPSGDAGSAGPSDEPSPSDASDPALEAVLPRQVGSVALTVDSATGTMILGGDQGSRAITAALRADGKGPEALSVAQAYDESAASDLSLMAFTVQGMAVDKTLKIVMDSWLSASGAGVKTDKASLGGRSFTRVDYGDGGAFDYVLAEKSVVIIITTSDPALAAQAAAALP